jgi:alpha-tubulin suppressor-like RCC1 family protein
MSSPVQVGALTNWAQVSAGLNNGNMGAIKTDGTLWTWGNSTSGLLGDNQASVNRSSPIQIGSLTDWSFVSAGSAHVVALKTSGTMWSWGSNSGGRLGQNIAATVSVSSPVQIGALTNWSRVSAYTSHTLAVTTSNTLYAWGYGAYGRLGLGNVINRSSPVQVGALTNWSQISAGSYHSAAIKTDGTLWAWGRNNNGQLGENTVVLRSSPVQVGALTDWSQISAGNTQTVAIKTDGTLWAWGNNNQGQVGDGTVVLRSSPVQIGALTSWYAVTRPIASLHTLALYGVV